MDKMNCQPVSLTIYQCLQEIERKDLLLPAFQREYVWSCNQIEDLFDSLLCGYPINTMMIWSMQAEQFSDKNFYEIPNNVNKDVSTQLSPCTLSTKQEIKALIDGQQRLTSIYIGLTGSYTYKPRNARKSIKTKLYLSLKDIDEETKKTEDNKRYNFKFLSDDVYKEEKDEKLWIPVKLIYESRNRADIRKHSNIQLDDDALDIVFELHNKIHCTPVITYYKIDSYDLGQIMDVFVRTNMGGSQLRYSDLLMGFLAGDWDEAKKEFHNLENDISAIGISKFKIDYDFILKAYLVLFCKHCKFKEFSEIDLRKIRENYDVLRNCIFCAFSYLSRNGFDNNNKGYLNAILLLIYYIYRNQLSECDTIIDRANENSIYEWVVLTNFKRIFKGNGADSTLLRMKKIIDDSASNNQRFPKEKIQNDENLRASYKIAEDDIENMLKVQKATPESFYFLSALYENLRYDDRFHQDHLHPEKYFTTTANKKYFENKEDQNFVFDSKNWNCIVNLQLLEGRENERKSDKPLKDWVNEDVEARWPRYSDKNISLDITDFRSFFENRKKNLKKKLCEILNVKIDTQCENESLSSSAE